MIERLDPTAFESVNPHQHATWPNQVLAWFKGRERYLLALGVGLQIMVLLGMTFHRAQPLLYGDTILLRVVPVDPRDLFRGDYVILGYDFSLLPPQGVEGLPATAYGSVDNAGRTVYVSLVPESDGEHWRADRFSLVRPTSGRFLCGTIREWNRVEFGIESYYVQEGTGRDYEQAIRDRTLSAEVAVDVEGRAALRALRIE